MPRLAILLGLVLTVGCTASLPMVQSHAPAASPGEGIVMGSVLVTIEEPTEKEPTGIFPLIKGANKAERFTYKFFLKKRGEVSPRHHLTVTPGQEEFFATRLPAGNYEFYAMKPKKTVLLGKLRILFEVQPGKTTYIGRLVARLP